MKPLFLSLLVLIYIVLSISVSAEMENIDSLLIKAIQNESDQTSNKPEESGTAKELKEDEADEPESAEEDDSEEADESEGLDEDEDEDEDDSEDTPSKLIETSGSIDFSYGRIFTDDGNESETDFSGSVDITITPNDNLSFHSTIGKGRETKLEIDEAYINWAIRDDQTIFLNAGKKFALFADQSSSEMISSSLPLQLGETDPDAIIEGTAELENWDINIYIFKGTSPQTDGTGKHELAYGLSAEYQTNKTSMGINYLSNLAESDAFDPNDVARKIPAIEIHGQMNLELLTINAAYLTTTKDFLPDDLDEIITTATKPSASQLEVDVDLNNEGILAFAWNTTRGTQEIDLPKEVLSMAYSQPISDKLTAAIELSRSEDHDKDKSKELIIEFSYDF